MEGADMTIDLADYEKGATFKGDYEAKLAELQQRLAKIQVAHIIHDLLRINFENNLS